MMQRRQKKEAGTFSLSKELTSLVDWSVTELGQVIRNELGDKGFQQIESIRRYVKAPGTRNLSGLVKLKNSLADLTKEEQFDIAHSFALMLELINSCETAYRTYRLNQEKTAPFQSKSFGRIIHVLTAHPTESRNTDIIYFFRKIQNLLIQRLENPNEDQTVELYRLLVMAWNLPMSKQRRPSVMDEAEYIYSLALQKNIIEIFLKNEHLGRPFYVRSWVGGDKDGNPFVDEQTMLGSLNMSRELLLGWIHEELTQFIAEIIPLSRSGLKDKKKVQSFLIEIKNFRNSLTQVKKLKRNDAEKIFVLKNLAHLLCKSHKSLLKTTSEHLIKITVLFKIFPGLVVPLELREDSTLVHEALKKSPKAMNISRMLQTLSSLSANHNPRYYVRGFILSQCESADDIVAGVHLAQRFCEARLPVVPLFESAHSLQNSARIIDEFLAVKKNRARVKKCWSSNLEVMLGYSDSAKENGSFPSRFLIQDALLKLERTILKHEVTPIFFHGSGGSIERGGGSVQEQTEWWPDSALNTVKTTVQGEMVYRNYSSPLILQRQLNLLIQNSENRRKRPGAKEAKASRYLLKELADFIQHIYQDTIKDPQFLDLIEKATPYSFLQDLRLGSRPSKRQGTVSLKKLRAIPWVLCWTQTRILFPTWWGIGTFWHGLKPVQKKEYQKLFQESTMFRSYIKALAFTLKKVEMDVFLLYLRSSKLNQTTCAYYEDLFKKEYSEALKCVFEITKEKSLLWYRPWLETSIDLRSPLIHPLNVLQLIALENKDIKLLRETVTGVASGMLTTG